VVNGQSVGDEYSLPTTEKNNLGSRQVVYKAIVEVFKGRFLGEKSAIFRKKSEKEKTNQNTYAVRAARLRFCFFIRLRCHFQRIWPFFFQRRELRFIACSSRGVYYKANVFIGKL
jgi:hypothetical protein